MKKLLSTLLLSLLFAFLDAETLLANDRSLPEQTEVKQQENEFRLPKRETKQETKSETTFDLKAMLGDSGIKVAIAIGIVLILLLLVSKQKSAKTIPGEAIEILGTVPFTSKQNIQLIRFGQKLVLIESSVNGLKPISEITDPAEVNQMLDLIRPRTR